MAERSERLRGTVIFRPVVYGNTALPITPETREDAPAEHTHRWTVALRSAASPDDGSTVGGRDDISYFVKRVAFKLHETYPNPNRIVEKPPFEVTETGWGEFEVQIRVTFVSEANEKPISFHHHLKLHAWAPQPTNPLAASPAPTPPDGPVNAWQYDEIVFTDPTKTFLDILLKHPPTPLPKTRRRGAPPHIAYPASLVNQAKGGGMPEFTQLMEKEEAERLDQAKKDIVAETDKLRNLLIEREKELERVKKEVEGMSRS
ncbi:NuA4 histone H4 acetyltransferase complex and the SWR1 complex subunit [Tulasnella sp. UAMH 9824]|nr:NuA4 histone H4 acetyltransferase complex and the SWR1 complex subunit [Tulasnella sp. UAMH 9824]